MNKKGFTLLELIVVVVIMVIILVIFTPRVLKMINKSELDSFTVKEQLVAKAGEDYVILNNIDLPTVVGQQKLINIQTLIQNDLVKKIYDLVNNDSECLGYVVIEKKSTYGHSYKSCLFCDNYITNDTDCDIERITQ